MKTMKVTDFLNVDKNKKENMKEHETNKKNHGTATYDDTGGRCGYDEWLQLTEEAVAG